MVWNWLTRGFGGRIGDEKWQGRKLGGTGDEKWHIYRKAGIWVGQCALMETHQQPGDPASWLYTAEQGSVFIVDSRTRQQVCGMYLNKDAGLRVWLILVGISTELQSQTAVIQEEEVVVDSLYIHCQHSIFRPGDSTCRSPEPDLGAHLPFPWIWGTGVLDMVVPMPTVYIQSGLHLLLTGQWRGSVGPGICCWARWLQAYPWCPHGRRTKSWELASHLHLCTVVQISHANEESRVIFFSRSGFWNYCGKTLQETEISYDFLNRTPTA